MSNDSAGEPEQGDIKERLDNIVELIKLCVNAGEQKAATRIEKLEAELVDALHVVTRFNSGTVYQHLMAHNNELSAQLAAMREALRSVDAQCGNVIYNCEQTPVSNDRHLDSWRNVQDYARRSALTGGNQ